MSHRPAETNRACANGRCQIPIGAWNDNNLPLRLIQTHKRAGALVGSPFAPLFSLRLAFSRARHRQTLQDIAQSKGMRSLVSQLIIIAHCSQAVWPGARRVLLAPVSRRRHRLAVWSSSLRHHTHTLTHTHTQQRRACESCWLLELKLRLEEGAPSFGMAKLAQWSVQTDPRRGEARLDWAWLSSAAMPAWQTSQFTEKYPNDTSRLARRSQPNNNNKRAKWPSQRQSILISRSLGECISCGSSLRDDDHVGSSREWPLISIGQGGRQRARGTVGARLASRRGEEAPQAGRSHAAIYLPSLMLPVVVVVACCRC